MGVKLRSGTVRERWNAHFIEDIDVSPHATGGRIGWQRRRAEGRLMGAEHGVAQALDVLGFVASPKMIKLNLRRRGTRLVEHVLDFVFEIYRTLSGYSKDSEIEAANLRGPSDPGRIAAAHRANLRLWNDGPARGLIGIPFLIVRRPSLQNLDGDRRPNDHIWALPHRRAIRQIRSVITRLIGKPRDLKPNLAGFHGNQAEPCSFSHQNIIRDSSMRH